MADLIGNEIPSAVDMSTQVYKVTHEGADRLPLRNRSFISFTYGGRAIEDFNFIATLQNRLQRPIYGAFEDITTHYDVLDGQYYWGSYFMNNTLDFNLSTDGVLEEELNEFKQWFRPGVIRELVLAESPNRAIWARVSTAPVMSLVPMEKQVTKKINGVEYTTSTTSYRGDMSLSFIMDGPFWHSRSPVIKNYYTNVEDKFGSMTDDNVEGAIETLSDGDFIKVIIEDGVPHSSMLGSKSVIILGNTDDMTTISTAIPAYLYYCGTAPGRPTMKITFTPKIENDYITYPLNTYSSNKDDAITYNIIKVGDREFRFTAPALLLGYNQAIKLMKDFKVGKSVEDARAALRDNIYEYHSRNWALFCIEAMIQNHWGVTQEGALDSGFFDKFVTYMKHFLIVEPESALSPVTITIDSKHGRAIACFRFRSPNVLRELPTKEDGFIGQTIVVSEENVEDMVRSNYLLIETRNSPNSNGNITEAECAKITTDYPTDILCNFRYENEYL